LESYTSAEGMYRKLRICEEVTAKDTPFPLPRIKINTESVARKNKSKYILYVNTGVA
jgi:hypothetical protein